MATPRRPAYLIATTVVAVGCAANASSGDVDMIVPDPGREPAPSASTPASITRHDPPPSVAPIDRSWQSCPPRKWVESAVDTSNADFPVSATGTRLVPLADGRVMAIDGDEMWGEVAVFDPKRDEYLYAPGMTTAHGIHSVPFLTEGRSHEAVVAMPDGTVMLIGGSTRKESPTKEVDVLDPRTWTVRPVASMHYTREDQGGGGPLQAILLPNGKVLAFGGNPFNAAEVYDPATDTWSDSQTPPMMFPPSPDSADVPKVVTLTGNGKVLAFGQGSYAACGRAFVYEVALDRWHEAPPLPTPKYPEAAVLLPDGRVMALGGGSCGSGPGAYEVDFFDPSTETWSVGAPWPTRMNITFAQLLPCGSVMLYGDARDESVPELDHFELYDPSRDAWSEPDAPLYGGGVETSAMLADGTFVIAYTGSLRRRMVMLR